MIQTRLESFERLRVRSVVKTDRVIDSLKLLYNANLLTKSEVNDVMRRLRLQIDCEIGWVIR